MHTGKSQKELHMPAPATGRRFFFALPIASCTRVRHLPQIAWHGACERRQAHSRAWHATCDFGPRVSMGPRNTQEKS